MITYKQLVEKTMPPEKRASAKQCIIGHYLVRPISNVISLPLISTEISPTSITIFSGVFPLIAFFSFALVPGKIGFWVGWIMILLWNIFDGVDGNIARYKSKCSEMGEVWDATVGWIAMIAFYMGMGFVAFYNPGYVGILSFIPNYVYLVLGGIAAMCWIFPRLVMHKKSTLLGAETVKGVKKRENYGIIKLLFFNFTSINGAAAVFFLLAFCLNLNALCMLVYFCVSMSVCVGALYSLLK